MEKQIKVKRVVVIGPESTGKSTLCQKLAQHFNTTFVPEYAREYLLTNGTTYTKDDLLIIAKNQVESEETIIQSFERTQSADKLANSSAVFIDTDLYVMKVWSEFVFNSCDNYILNGIATRKYDLYLLCLPDLPWVKDELREYPDQVTRQRLYQYYKDALIHQSTPWVEISGDYDRRLEKAISAVNQLF